jgi:hypothetical protein
LRPVIPPLLVGLALVAGCGSSGSTSAGEQPSNGLTTTATIPTTAEVETATPALVGRWKHVNECQELVKALEDSGLGAIALSVVGDYFPEIPAEELAQKDDLCEGAEPIVHYHFFDEDGRFGSLDENEEQVDDGTYKIIDDRTFVISKEFPDTTFHYEIEGDALTLSPVVTRAMKKEALANPQEFTVAGWANSVSYPGQEWKRVDCRGWCPSP